MTGRGVTLLAAHEAILFCRDVRLWHLADIDADDEHVCFWG
jgi:hypothetical protein